MYELGLTNKITKYMFYNFLNFNVSNYIVKQNEKLSVFFGVHGDSILFNYNLILPMCTGLEASGLYMNNEGRIQEAKQIQKIVVQSKIDWKYVLQYFDYLYGKLNINKLTRNMLALEYSQVYNIILNNVSYNTFFVTRTQKFQLYNVLILPFTIAFYGDNDFIKNSRIIIKANMFYKNKYIYIYK